MKKKKKWILVLSIVAASLLVLLLGIYIAINVAFSMFSESFYQSIIESEEFAQANGNAGETSNGQTPTGSEDGETAQQPKPDNSGDEGILKKIPYEKIKNMTPEEFKALEKKISFNDKVAVLNILSTNLSTAEYQEIVGMVGGGITKEEIKRAHQILSKSLSSENKKKIWGYYDKYIHLIQ